MIPSWLRYLLMGVVLMVWAVNVTAPIFVREYQPPPEIHVAFMAILGLLTAAPKPPSGKSKKDLEK